MTCYVDDMYQYALGQYGRMKMSHLIADTDEELHAMAARIGVARRWWQSPERTSGIHYDIAMSKREFAIAAGAVPITLKQCSAMNARRRVTGELGDPADAEQWLADWSEFRRAQLQEQAGLVEAAFERPIGGANGD
jgi:hypothetical protein